MNRIHYSACPVCHSKDIDPLMTIKDFSVSQESFVVWQCSHCLLRFTQDVPDEAAIGPYYQSPDYISHTNTNKGLINQLYQKVRTYTLQEKASLIYKYTKHIGTVLDVGAGTGTFLRVMKEKGWQTTGIEPDEGARDIAKKDFNIDLLARDQFAGLPSDAFDAITMWHVLEHVQQLHEYMDHLKNMLKQNGRLFIAVPNYTSADAAIYKNFWAAYDVPRHLYHFSPRSMEALLQQHGLKLLDKKPMWFDSFYISFISSRYKAGHVNWVAAGINGLRSNLTAFLNKDRCSSLIYIIGKS